ncbi:hypothetical protein D1872_286610 [compost metagenome]
MIVHRPLYRVFQRPHPVQQLFAGERLVPVLVKKLQQCEFLRQEFDGLRPDGDRIRGRIQH